MSAVPIAPATQGTMSAPQDGPSKPPRRRARRACLPCRGRKVRCDVVDKSPCSNCEWDNLDCVVVGRRNGKYFRVNAPNTKVKMNTEEDFECETPAGMRPAYNFAGPMDAEENPDPSGHMDTSTTYASSHHSSDQMAHQASEAIDTREQVLENTTLELIPTPSGHSNSQDGVTCTGDATDDNLAQHKTPMSSFSSILELPKFMHFPGFIKPLATKIAVDDLAYLNSKGALELPSRQCQNALLWSFFEWVYPFMPLLDLDEFLKIVSSEDGSSGQVSLLLYRAVLFAGTAHVKIDYLKEAGFQTRKQARKAFFQRVRLLYDFNTERDRLVLVQALLLMTLWYETPEEHRNTWYWIDVAISQCFATGLHRDPAMKNPPLPPRVQRLRRRIWWSCFHRDRLISLGMRRPPRIKDDDYNVAMLEETDFEAEERLDDDDKLYSRMCSYVLDTRKRGDLARLCIANASLCRCLKYYLRPHYSIFSENPGDGSAETFRMPRTDDKDIFASCYEDLLTWYNSLSETCKYRSLSCESRKDNSSVALSRTLLHMTYYAAVVALHRTRFTLLLHSPGASLYDQELSKICMQHAAVQISNMAGEIHKHALDSLLPTSGITVVVSAAATHMLEMKGMIQADKQKAYEGFRRCMQVIGTLQDMYVAADLAKDAMEWAFVQPQSAGPSPAGNSSAITEPGTTPMADSMGLVGRPVSSAGYNAPGPATSMPSLFDSTSLRQLDRGFKHSPNQAQLAFLEELSEIPMVDIESFETSILFGEAAFP